MFAPQVEAQTTLITYTFEGPYYERTGEVAGASGAETVKVTFQGVDGTSAIYLTGNGVTADSYVYSGNALSYLTYNASSALNLTRTIELISNDYNSTIKIYLPYPNEPINTYYFSVTDYTGSVQYLQADTVDPTGNHLVERKPLGISGTVSFVMEQYTSYVLTIIGTKGSLAQSFFAENIYTTNLPVLLGSFPEATYGYTVFAGASRFNATALQVNYADSNADTTAIYVTISHRSGTSVFTDYYYAAVTYGAPVAFGLRWSDAMTETSYTVNVTALVTGYARTWLFTVPTISTTSNPWQAVLEPFTASVATLPGSAVLPTGFAIAQVPAAIIIALVLAIFSAANHEAGCLLCWVVTGVMVLLGWFVVSVPAFGFALFMSVLIVFVEGKKTEREL